MPGWNLRKRFLFMAIVPSVSISLLLGAYLLYMRISDLQDFIVERGKASSQQLAALSRHTILHHDRALVQSLLSSTLEEQGIRAVSLYDREGNLLAHNGPRMMPIQGHTQGDMLPSLGTGTGANHQSTPGSIRFRHPILTTSAGSANPELLQDILGWVEVEYSYDTFTIKTYQTILISALLIVFALSLTGLLAQRLYATLRSSVQRLSNGLKQLERGNLGHRIELVENSQLGDWARNIDAMAESIEHSYQELQDNVEQTTSDLRQTLETIEIQNIELDMARREAVEASRVKSEFLANTSHEIRTPLNGIIGFTNLLLNGESNSRKRDYLQTIQQSAASLLAIINDILDFSKIEAGKLSLEHIKLNLRQLLDEALTLMAPDANEKGLELALIMDADTPDVICGDPLRIKQIITNLLANAIKFTAQGSVVVRVRLGSGDGERLQLKISVTDSGIGLTSQQQRGLFEAFSQADGSTGREFGGTGLGLVISRRLVESMGGSMGLTSEAGKGSTFWFTVQTPLNMCSYETENQDALRGVRIALVEPNDASAMAIRQLLESWHCVVDEYESVDQLTRLQAQARWPQPDTPNACLVALDRVLADAAEIRSQQSLFKQQVQLPFLFLASGHVTGNQAGAAEEVDVLSKPVPSRKLYARLCELCNGDDTNRKPLAAPAIQSGMQRPRVMAVDDNPANLKLLMILLEQAGVDATAADNGQQALSLTLLHKFDLILMDIQMPGMDGIETTRAIRATGANPNCRTPVIALTAHALFEEQKVLLEVGFNDYLSKPLDNALLERALLTWCTNYSPLTSSTATIPGTTADPALLTVDRSMCLNRVNSHPQLARQMLSSLLDSLCDDRDTILQCFDKGDRAALQEAVHKLHGATCYTGVPALGVILRKLETAVKRGVDTDIQLLIPQLMQQVDSLLQWRQQHDLDLEFE